MSSKKNKTEQSSGGARRPVSAPDRPLSEQTIKVSNMPGHVRVFVPSLPKGKDLAVWDPIEEGNLVSEVGFPGVWSVPMIGESILAFELRTRPPPKHLPTFTFGDVNLGFTYAAFQPILVSLPVVGSSITLNPVLTVDQYALVSHYDYIRADAIWVVQIPSPLGVAMILRAYAPELDTTTETKGVRWKPNAVTAIAFHQSWSNDLAFVDKETGRMGQSGLSLVLQTLEDNSIDSVNTPLRATVWCCVFNIQGVVLNHSETDWVGQELTGLNFIPQPVTADMGEDQFSEMKIVESVPTQ